MYLIKQFEIKPCSSFPSSKFCLCDGHKESIFYKKGKWFTSIIFHSGAFMRRTYPLKKHYLEYNNTTWLSRVDCKIPFTKIHFRIYHISKLRVEYTICMLYPTFNKSTQHRDMFIGVLDINHQKSLF